MEKNSLHHSAVEQPDGEIQYGKPISINKQNPYLDEPINNDNNQDYREIECDGEIITIHVTTLNKALNLQGKAHVVRFLCLIDFTMNLLIALNIYYHSLYSFGIAAISLIGYHSTFTYSRTELITYLLYQYCHSLFKILGVGFYIAVAAGWNTFELKNNTHISIEVTPSYIILLSISMFGQLYITDYIRIFYNLLPDTTPEQSDLTRFSIV
jgi:hypothetical protein